MLWRRATLLQGCRAAARPCTLRQSWYIPATSACSTRWLLGETAKLARTHRSALLSGADECLLLCTCSVSHEHIYCVGLPPSDVDVTESSSHEASSHNNTPALPVGEVARASRSKVSSVIESSNTDTAHRLLLLDRQAR